MAIIIPFGDGNAHGSLAGSISFRRIRGGVVMEKKPRPRITHTVAQLACRTAFTNANQGWYTFDLLSRPYFESRATQIGITPRNLYTRAVLQGIMPAVVYHDYGDIISAELVDNTGLDGSNFFLKVWRWCQTYVQYFPEGVIDPVTNTWVPDAPPPNVASQRRLEIWSTYPLAFRNGIIITFDNNLGGTITQTFRFMGGVIPIAPVFKPGMTKDGSLWYDDNYFHWWTTNNF